MKTLIVIPARYGASRLPGKPLLDIGGETMVVRVWRRCRVVPGEVQVLVATDDERIVRCVEEAGGEAVMTSPGHTSGTDRVAEAAADRECDLVINVQGDEPFIDPSSVGKLITYFSGGGDADAATLAAPVEKSADLFDPAVVKVLIGDGGRGVCFSRYPVPFSPDLWEIDGRRWTGRIEESSVKKYFRHLGIYAFRPGFLRTFTSLGPTDGEVAERLEQLRILEHGYRIHVVVTAGGGPGVDTAEDLERARRKVGVKA